MTIRIYIFSLMADSGLVKIKTAASCLESAINIILNSEQCPLSALVAIEEY